MTTPIRALDARMMAVDPEEVWRILYDARRAEKWWPRELRLKVLKNSADLVGSEFQIWPKGGRPFNCRFVAVDIGKSISTEYFGGFIVGKGIWRIETAAKGCKVSYELDVEASGLFVVLLSKFISFSKMHSKLMDKVLENLEMEALREKT